MEGQLRLPGVLEVVMQDPERALAEKIKIRRELAVMSLRGAEVEVIYTEDLPAAIKSNGSFSSNGKVKPLFE